MSSDGPAPHIDGRDAFLRLYPWPAADLALGKPLEWLWHFDLPVSAAQLWPHLIETSRFNRAIGLSEMHFDERDGVMHGWAVNAGVRQEWIEVPWEWTAERMLISGRRYSRGYAHYVRAIFHLEPLGDRVRLTVSFGWIPRGLLGKLMLRLSEGYIRRGFTRVLDEVVADIDAARPAAYVQAPPPLSDDVDARLRTIRQGLLDEGLNADAVELLVRLVRDGDDMDLNRIQALRLARERGVDEDALVNVCLHSTRHGLLDMSWDVVCPHCRGVREESGSLAKIPSEGTCEVCEIDFATAGENAIEITFHVHPSIRNVPKVYYCSAEPSTKLHIALQQRVGPRDERRVATALAPGRYRLRVQGTRDYKLLDIVDDDEEPEVGWCASGDPSAPRCGRAPALVLNNDADDDRTFVVETARWTDDALRPGHLFSRREFRDLYSAEYLGTDVQLWVGEQTLLFTDMVGSTRFYASRGDPDAFMEVKRHFAEVDDVVSEHQGVVVKTIGDAVMAAFSSPVSALRASRRIHDRFFADRSDTSVRLRISLNTGPCIAVNLNSGVDYFGGTVNIAAKLQAFAEAGQVAFSRAVHDAPGVAAYLEEVGARLEPLTFESKALDAPISLFRWDTHADRNKVAHSG